MTIKIPITKYIYLIFTLTFFRILFGFNLLRNAGLFRYALDLALGPLTVSLVRYNGELCLHYGENDYEI